MPLATVGEWIVSIFPENITTRTEIIWELVALVGNFFFFSRFLVQWIASERNRKTTIPEAFWYLSLIGTAIMFVYAIHVGRPVLMLAYSANVLIYVRNLVIHRRSQRITPLGS